MQGKYGHSLTTSKQVHQHNKLTDMAEPSGGSFSGMKRIVNLFYKKTPNVTNSKALTPTDIPMVTRYAREVYLAVFLLLSCDWSIYGKSVKDMGNI